MKKVIVIVLPKKFFIILKIKKVQILKPYKEIEEFLSSPTEKLLIIKGMAGS